MSFRIMSGASVSNTKVLFVYGTLLTTCRSEMGRLERQRLRQECRRVGEAAIPGQLISLGAYPVLREGPCDAPQRALVFGEALALNAPCRTFAWLDRYEGIGAGPGLAGPYQRVERFIDILGCGRQLAWLYVCRGKVQRSLAIPGGRWCGPTR